MKPKHAFLLLFVFALFGSCSVTKKTDDGGLRLKILSYNVRNARGMDDEVNFDRVAKVINRINADCVALQELDSATRRSGGVVVLDELAKRTHMYAVYNSSIDYDGGKYGIGILTKEKPLRHEAIALPGSEEKRSLLVFEMKDCVFCCTHWSLRQADRLASVALMNEVLEKYTHKPVFLAGDLNAVPASEEMAELTKQWIILNDPFQPTIPVVNPNRCIDYVLFKDNPQFHVRILETKVENEPLASDHLPVWVEVKVSKNN